MPARPAKGFQYLLRGSRRPFDHEVVVFPDGRCVRRYEATAGREEEEEEESLSPVRRKILDLLVGEERPFTRGELATRFAEIYDEEIQDSAVATHIGYLRKALGCDAADSGFVETTGSAYRICAEIVPGDFDWPPPPPSRSEATEPVPRAASWIPRGWRRRRRSIAFIALLLVAVTTTVFVLRQSFYVGTGDIRLDPEANAALEDFASDLVDRVEQELSKLPAWSLYRFSNSPLLQTARVDYVIVDDATDSEVKVEATIRGLPSGEEPRTLQEGFLLDEAGLEKKIVFHLRLHLDLEACHQELDLAPWHDREANKKRRARHCLEAGGNLRWALRFFDALEPLETAYRFDPDLVEALDLFVSVNQNLGRDEKALEWLKRLEPPADPVKRKRIERRIAELEGRFGDALAILEDLAEKNPEQRSALAWFHLVHGQDCERAREIADGDADSTPVDALTRAEIEIGCGNPRKAVRLFDEHYDETGDLGSLVAHAYAHRLSGSPADAADKLESALDELVPGPENRVRARIELAHLHAERGLLEEARRQIDGVLESFGPLGNANGVGIECPCRSASRDACQRSVLERETLLSASSFHLAAGKPARAIELARCARDGRSLRALWAEGRAALAAGRRLEAKRAENDLETTFERRERGGSRWQGHYLHHLRGRRLLAEGKANEAAEELGRVFDFAVAERAFYLTEWAEALRLAGRAHEARKRLEEALAVDAAHLPALCALGTLASETGESSRVEALGYFDKAKAAAFETGSGQETGEELCRRLFGE